MRPLYWVTLDKRRPAVVLTREHMVGRMSTVVVAPISSVVHGLVTELPVGRDNGLSTASAVKCDQITSIPLYRLDAQCGWLLEEQEPALREAIQAAFDLR